MANPYNGSKHGKRGGRKHTPDFVRSIEADSRKLGWNGCTQDLVNAAAIAYPTEAYSETKETHIIPRKSRGDQLHLGIVAPVVVDSITIKGLQAEVVIKYHGNGLPYRHFTGRMIPYSDEKVLKMSDKTLLNRGNPFIGPEQRRHKNSKIRRQTSVTKEFVTDPETEFTPEPYDNPTTATLTAEEIAKMDLD